MYSTGHFVHQSMAGSLQKFLYRTIALNVFMEPTDIYEQQPPKSLYLNVIQSELSRIVTENIKTVAPIDFCLNGSILDPLKSDEYPPSLLEGHEDDPPGEKQSNFFKIFVYIAIYFNNGPSIIIHWIQLSHNLIGKPERVIVDNIPPVFDSISTIKTEIVISRIRYFICFLICIVYYYGKTWIELLELYTVLDYFTLNAYFEHFVFGK